MLLKRLRKVINVLILSACFMLHSVKQFQAFCGNKQVYKYLTDSLKRTFRDFPPEAKDSEPQEAITQVHSHGCSRIKPSVAVSSLGERSAYLRQESGPLGHSTVSLLVTLPCLREKTFCLMAKSKQADYFNMTSLYPSFCISFYDNPLLVCEYICEK